ncbi:MAG TPA: hypothetical protein VFH68_03880 [Polyangia bacterium]|jgi:hypothetical protein|nr:hypothetical protein [Polyangia bacterium]
MDRTGPDFDLAKQSLQGAEVALRRLLAAASPVGASVSADQIRGAGENVVRALAEVDKALTGDAEPARIACPSCARKVMPAATLCGFCWRRLDPKPSV